MNYNNYKKVMSILKLQQLGLNMHNTVITKDLDYAMATILDWKGIFSLRTDSTFRTEDLPFIFSTEEILSKNDERYKAFLQEVEGFLEKGYCLIIADGIKHDPIQSYNAVLNIKPNGDFKIEISTEKIPLRKMYNGNTYYLKGNITEKIRYLETSGKQCYDKNLILRDVSELYKHKIFNKDIEFTKYPINLGMKNDEFVFWQIR